MNRKFVLLLALAILIAPPAPTARAQGEVPVTSTVTATSMPTMPTTAPCFNVVSGTVWHDLDGDGGPEANEGVKDALVSLYTIDDGLLAYQTTSEAGGMYRFRTNILCGIYKLTAEWKGEAGERQIEVGEAGVPEVDIEIKMIVHPIVYRAYLPLVQAQVCVGTVVPYVVFHDVNGNNERDVLEPEVGAVVILKFPDGHVVFDTTLGPGGSGWFSNVPYGGLYRIDAFAPGLGLAGSAQFFVPISGTAVMVPMHTVPVQAASGDCASNISGTAYWDKNTNSQIDAGEPVSATMMLYTPQGDYRGIVEAADDGRFDFGQKDCGIYVLQGANPALHLYGYRTITVTEAFQVQDLAMVQDPWVVISGTVFDDLDGNSRQDSGEPGVYGNINVLSANFLDLDSVRTDNDGRYAITLWGQDVQSQGYLVNFRSIPAGVSARHLFVPPISVGETYQLDIPVRVKRRYLPLVVK